MESKRLTVELPHALHDQLKALSRERDQSMSQLIRAIVRELIGSRNLEDGEHPPGTQRIFG